MGNTFYFSWEVSLIEWLQSNLGENIYNLLSPVFFLGDIPMMIVIMGFIYWSLNKEAGKYIGVALTVNTVWNPMIKNLVPRRRPYFDNPSIKCLKPVDTKTDIYDIASQGYSFPSGHSCNSATVYGSIAKFFGEKWLTVICITVTFIIGASRFYVGVHYPTDVIFGWALGAVILFLIPWLQKKIKNRHVFFAVILLTCLPGIFFCRTTDYYTGLGMMIGIFAAIDFEEKYVKFENTRKPVGMILRVAGGVIIYLVLNYLLKLPFSADFLASETAACFAVRVLRYAIVSFADTGLYPLLFKKWKKIFG